MVRKTRYIARIFCMGVVLLIAVSCLGCSTAEMNSSVSESPAPAPPVPTKTEPQPPQSTTPVLLKATPTALEDIVANSANTVATSPNTLKIETDEARVERVLQEIKGKSPGAQVTALLPLLGDYSAPAKRAQAAIVALGKEAIPTLIASLEDKQPGRFIWGARPRTLTLGETSFGVLEQIVEPDFNNAKSRMGKNGEWVKLEGYLSHYSPGTWFTKASVEEWWREHNGVSLRQIRINALKWKIAYEKKAGFPDAQSRAYFLKPLERRLAALQKSSGP